MSVIDRGNDAATTNQTGPSPDPSGTAAGIPSLDLIGNEQVVGYPAELVEQYRQAGVWRDETIPQALQRVAGEHPDELALIGTTGQITYAELVGSMDRVAAGLLAAGFEPGQRVIMQITNSLPGILLWYGMLRAGLVPICTLPIHRRHEIGQIATLAGASVHVVQADAPKLGLVDFALEMREVVPSLRRLLTLGEPQAPTPDDAVAVEELIDRPLTDGERDRLDQIAARTDLSAPAILQLSGGTTGTPKIIPRLHPEYWYNGECTARWWSLGVGDRLAFGLPMVHNACMANGMYAAHSVGATLLLATPQADVILPLMAEHRATWFMSPPGLMRDYQAHPRFDEAMASVKNCILTAAAVPRALFDELEGRGVHICQAFGMTEGQFIFTRSDAAPEQRAGSVGIPISELDELRILDPAGEAELPDGQVGEISVRGPYTIRGYLNAPEHNAVVFTADGFYRTGDLGSIEVLDGDRCLVLAGRSKDLINRGGEKINAEEVEKLLRQHPAVADVAIVAMPDERLGERACAFIAVQPGQPEPQLADLCAFLDRQGVAKFKWPERLEVRDVLPRTNIGKLRKADLRSWLTEAQAPAQ